MLHHIGGETYKISHELYANATLKRPGSLAGMALCYRAYASAQLSTSSFFLHQQNWPLALVLETDAKAGPPLFAGPELDWQQLRQGAGWGYHDDGRCGGMTVAIPLSQIYVHTYI